MKSSQIRAIIGERAKNRGHRGRASMWSRSIGDLEWRLGVEISSRTKEVHIIIGAACSKSGCGFTGEKAVDAPFSIHVEYLNFDSRVGEFGQGSLASTWFDFCRIVLDQRILDIDDESRAQLVIYLTDSVLDAMDALVDPKELAEARERFDWRHAFVLPCMEELMAKA